MADGVAHLPDLPVPAFPDDDAQVPGAEGLHVRGPRLVAVDDDPFLQPIEIVVVWHAEDAGFVDARDAVAGMRQLRGEIAVVGQQQQPLGVVVEPSDRIDVVAHAAQEIDDRLPPLRVGARRDVAARFVEQQIQVARGDLDAAAVDTDVIARRIRLGAELADGGAVDAHAPVEHQLLGCAPRRDAGLRQDLLQTFHHQERTRRRTRRGLKMRTSVVLMCCSADFSLPSVVLVVD